MSKVLKINIDKCTGCRTCEMVCSLKKEGIVNPSKSRIKIARWDERTVDMPVVCQQCEDPLCLTVCPVNARSRNEKLGNIDIDEDMCIGCQICLVACPFGGNYFDPVNNKVIKCDLCQGDPECVKFCETKAIEYIEEAALNTRNRITAAQKIMELAKEYAR